MNAIDHVPTQGQGHAPGQGQYHHHLKGHLPGDEDITVEVTLAEVGQGQSQGHPQIQGHHLTEGEVCQDHHHLIDVTADPRTEVDHRWQGHCYHTDAIVDHPQPDLHYNIEDLVYLLPQGQGHHYHI